MAKARITRTSIDKLEAVPGKQVSYFDSKLTGFGVKVNSTSRTYFVQCRIKDRKNASGNQMEIYESIGRTDVVDYDKALTKAKTILENAADGIAPDDIRAQNEDLEAEKIINAANEAKKDITLQEGLEEYMTTRKKLKASTRELYQVDIDRYVPEWKSLPLRSINGTMILSKHSEIGARSPARADGTMRVIRAVFNHVIQMHDDVVSKNPVKKLSAVAAWYNVKRKETYIKPSDIKAWMSGALRLGYDTSTDFLLVMLFQGSRKEETSTLRWKDVNLAAGTAKFRETKTGIVLEVPLSQFIIDRLSERMKYYYDGPESFVFPSYGSTGHITDSRRSLQVIFEHSGVKATHHDLRRSFISYCEELEITIFTRKRLANHAIPLDVTEGYTLFNMDKLRMVIEKIAAFILGHAGIAYQGVTPKPLTEEQIAMVAESEFWGTLNEDQKTAFVNMVVPQKEKAPNVISLEAVKVRRRIGK